MVNKFFLLISYGLAIVALIAGVAMLVGDAEPGILSRLPEATISAAPLLLVGTAFLILQAIIRPRLSELLKNVLVAATFLLWGAIQLMPQNTMSKRLGNVVIALYVLDLGWVILGSKIPRERN
jgi:hypothetical protein